MSRFLLIVLLAAVVVPAIFLTSDFGERPPSPLRVGTNVWPGYEPLYLARSLGHLDPDDIQLVELRSSTDTMQLLRSGDLEAAALTLDEALDVAQDGFDLGVVLIMDLSQGGDVLMARPGIDSLSALRGKRIGVESSAVGAILLDGALEAAALPVEAVDIVPLKVDEHEQAYRQGLIDAVVTFEPVATRLRQAGAVTLFTSAAIPERIVDVLVVRRDLVAGRTAALRRLLTGYFEALAYLHDHPEAAARRIAPRMSVTPAQALRAYRGLHLPDLAENRVWLEGPTPKLVEAATKIKAIMLAHGLLRREVRIEPLPEAAYLPGAAP
ncbi:NitT/TauT family transport system substrate-binding protein [Methylomarinovum tepidoasis]|uniref:NitT/TauT family transport system substrate-binding protein n=1 Tax=Methylomarinovum tepidoasis TaxID=2840183 RepID=A0AAU9CAD7_9GAMM|nr:ABC transporter substrate-binding protein [Methylomarinovum sp. IN45]BCX88907.1 NitT/TauT family transport system substrate-binding protein [Methylomarinovum sp. IN45]